MSSIPKTIHCIWLGSNNMPEYFNDALRSWGNTHPDYEIMVWTDMDFDFNKMPKYVRDAYNDKCYAIASDYIRAKVLYEHGGWYLDMDVELLKPFMDDYSKCDFVVPAEDSLWDWPEERVKAFYENNVDATGKHVKSDYVSGVALLISVMGAKKGCRYTKDVMDFYKTLDYEKRDYTGCLFGGPIGPQVYAKVMENYGFLYKPEEQKLKRNILVLSPQVARNYRPELDDDYLNDEKLYAMHHSTFSWFAQFMEKSGLGDAFSVIE